MTQVYSEPPLSTATERAWIHELSRAETLPPHEQAVLAGASFEPRNLIEESALHFMDELRQHLVQFARIFNELSHQGTAFSEIKIYSVAQTTSDFMLFRNQVKLTLAYPAHGVIQLAYFQHPRGIMSVNGQSAPEATAPSVALPPPQEITAEIGPFRKVFWSYRGEKVAPPEIAKFYFIEFAKLSRKIEPSRTGHHLLLEQIKTLLQNQGLDLQKGTQLS